MKTKEVKGIILEIPLLNNYKEFSKVDKGWSKDDKYYLESEDGKKYLLRINTVEYLSVKEKEYKIMKKVSKLGVKLSKRKQKKLSLFLLT